MPDVRAKVGYIHPNLVGRALSKEEKIRLLNFQNRAREGLVTPEVTFHDARELAARGEEAPTLARNGVTLVPFVSSLGNYRDLEVIRKVLYPEAEALVREHTGAAYVWTFHHTVRDVRSKEPLFNDMESVDAALLAHTDATYDGATEAWCRRRLKGELGLPPEATTPEKMDVAVIGVWKPWDREVLQHPLALLDFQTFAPQDMVPSNPSTVGIGGTMPGTLTETFKGAQAQLKENKAHRWLFWSRMQTDEALLFKQMDSRPNQGITFHTAFEDPTAPKDAPGRRSVEIRVLAGFPKAQQAAL